MEMSANARVWIAVTSLVCVLVFYFPLHTPEHKGAAMHGVLMTTALNLEEEEGGGGLTSVSVPLDQPSKPKLFCCFLPVIKIIAA